MIRNRFSFLLVLASLMAPAAAQTGGTAHLQAQGAAGGRGGEFTIEYDAAGQARIAKQDGDRGYLLVRDGRTYSVREDAGTPVVHDLAQLAATIRNSPLAGRRRGEGGRFAGRAPGFAADVAQFGQVTNTGRKETVAGLVGEVHLLDYTGPDGQARQVEMVISNAPEARAFSQAMRGIGERVQAALGKSSPSGGRVLWDWLERQQAGLLRLGDSLRLHSLDPGTPPAERFALPAAPTQVRSLRDLRGMRRNR